MKDLMKNNSVTMVEFKKVTTTEQESVIENIVVPAMRNIFNESDEKFIAVEEIDGRDIMFLFVEQSKVDAFINLLNENNLLDASRDVMEEILMGDFEDVKLEKMMQSDEFKSIFDAFLLKNLDSNMVLDKLGIKGMDKLTDVDKIILEKMS